MKSLLVALQDLKLHEDIAAAIAHCAEHLPDRFAASELSPEGVHHLCLAFPIRAVRQKGPGASKRGGKARAKSGYLCIGGLRTFQIAKARLPGEARVRILVQDEADGEIGPSALRELFLGAVAFGIRGSRNAAQLEALRKTVPVGLLTEHFPRIKSRTAMTRIFGFGRTALSPRAAKGGSGTE